MRANRRRDTGPELAVRRLLHASGLRFRVDYPIRPDPGRLIRPDIVFTKARIAVFIDGCFWHGCPEHGRRAAGVNAEYWGPKIARNRERDAEHNVRLASAGWSVLRFWEHEPPAIVATHVADAVSRGGCREKPAVGWRVQRSGGG
jgi:DNA mismatch endonuclease (patch repair protein)